MNLFIAYIEEDIALKHRLTEHLHILQREGILVSWHDGMLSAGSDWSAEINDFINKADVILLLISSDFMADDDLYETQVKLALKRQKQNGTKVIPVILRDCIWKIGELGKLTPLPPQGIPVVSNHWNTEDEPYRLIAEELRNLAGGNPTPDIPSNTPASDNKPSNSNFSKYGKIIGIGALLLVLLLAFKFFIYKNFDLSGKESDKTEVNSDPTNAPTGKVLVSFPSGIVQWVQNRNVEINFKSITLSTYNSTQNLLKFDLKCHGHYQFESNILSSYFSLDAAGDKLPPNEKTINERVKNDETKNISVSFLIDKKTNACKLKLWNEVEVPFEWSDGKSKYDINFYNLITKKIAKNQRFTFTDYTIEVELVQVGQNNAKEKLVSVDAKMECNYRFNCNFESSFFRLKFNDESKSSLTIGSPVVEYGTTQKRTFLFTLPKEIKTATLYIKDKPIQLSF